MNVITTSKQALAHIKLHKFINKCINTNLIIYKTMFQVINYSFDPKPAHLATSINEKKVQTWEISEKLTITIFFLTPLSKYNTRPVVLYKKNSQITNICGSMDCFSVSSYYMEHSYQRA